MEGSEDQNLSCLWILCHAKLQGQRRITSSSSSPHLWNMAGLLGAERAAGGTSNSMKGGARDCLKGGPRSLVSQFSLTSRLLRRKVPITVLQSGGFVTVVWLSSPSCWTWTSTTGGITVSLLRSCVREGLMPFFWQLSASDTVELGQQSESAARERLSVLYLKGQGFGPSNCQGPTITPLFFVTFNFVCFFVCYDNQKSHDCQERT